MTGSPPLQPTWLCVPPCLCLCLHVCLCLCLPVLPCPCQVGGGGPSAQGAGVGSLRQQGVKPRRAKSQQPLDTQPHSRRRGALTGTHSAMRGERGSWGHLQGHTRTKVHTQPHPKHAWMPDTDIHGPHTQTQRRTHRYSFRHTRTSRVADTPRAFLLGKTQSHGRGHGHTHTPRARTDTYRGTG